MYVVETAKGEVVQVIDCGENEQSIVEHAKCLCHENGINYTGDLSVDGNILCYSVQIVR